MHAVLDAAVFLVFLVLLPCAVLACVPASPDRLESQAAYDMPRGMIPTLLSGLVFIATLGLMAALICWRQAAYDRLIARMTAVGDIVLVPGWAQVVLFAVVPAALTSWALLRIGRYAGLGRLRRGRMRLRPRSSPTAIMVLICNLLGLAVSFPSYAVFGAQDMVIRPWPYGRLATYRLSYDQVSAVSKTRERTLGRFGGVLTIDDYTIVFSTGLSWTTQYSADGSSEVERASALRRVLQKSGVVVRPSD